MMRRTALWISVAAVAFGLASEAVAFEIGEPDRWIPDMVTGWILIGCGLVAWVRRSESATGPLLAATGLAWFLGNFAAVGGLVGWVGRQGVFLHRGPLFHAVIAYPTGRPSSPVSRGAVVLFYAVSVVPAVWSNGTSTIVLAVLFLAVTAFGYARSVGPDRRARLVSLEACAGLSAVIVASAIARLMVPTPDVGTVALLAYEVTLCAAAAWLTAGFVAAPAAVTDLVVELGEGRPGDLRAELARALGDPTLEVGYWRAEDDSFIDADGRVVQLPSADPARAVTIVEGDDHPVAVLVHDPAVLDDPPLVDGVTAAARLAVSNARLRAEVQTHVRELEASRRRLLHASDDERRALERALRDGAERSLREVGDALRRTGGSADGETARRVGSAEAQLDGTLEDLRRLARGLHPGVLVDGGLAPALEGLRETFPLPLRIEVPVKRLGRDLELVTYFTCSEALANVAKHAQASSAEVSATVVDEQLVIRVEDDGAGGADPAAGSGLRGLADRIETIGGTLRVESVPDGGTRLTAEIPLGGEAT
ncbi:MAG TPA: ATP-binding protein [Actinomycetota bacterium]|nr:ATP-binding protein [Actinomycetota bacterium]